MFLLIFKMENFKSAEMKIILLEKVLQKTYFCAKFGVLLLHKAVILTVILAVLVKFAIATITSIGVFESLVE